MNVLPPHTLPCHLSHHSLSTSLGAVVSAYSCFMHREHLIRHNQTKTHTCWEKWGSRVIKKIKKTTIQYHYCILKENTSR